jgi:hypothetical protein
VRAATLVKAARSSRAHQTAYYYAFFFFVSLSLFPERKKEGWLLPSQSEEVLYLTHFCIYETVE